MGRQYLTFKFKLKNPNKAKLRILANKVNFVWNYCNETSFRAIKRDGKFLSWLDLQYLTSGTSKCLKINAQTIVAIIHRYANSRKIAKKRKLEWRHSSGPKRSLGWIPLTNQNAKLKPNGSFKYSGITYKYFNSRPLEGKFKSGEIVEDSCGDWHVCFTCEVDVKTQVPHNLVGVDLGLNNVASTSDGIEFVNPKYFKKSEEKLANAQRFKKKKQAARLHRKIARQRADYLHKISYFLASNYSNIYFGNLKLKDSKSTNEASFRRLITYTEYKASRRQGEVKVVNEAHSTVTCSNCLERTGPQGLSGLSVREWTCASCGQMHSRDTNAALNILRIGFNTPMILNEPQAS